MESHPLETGTSLKNVHSCVTQRSKTDGLSPTRLARFGGLGRLELTLWTIGLKPMRLRRAPQPVDFAWSLWVASKLHIRFVS
jgi:hypothetical protein